MRAVGIVVAVLSSAVLLAAPASAQPGLEELEIRIRVEPDGVLAVTETTRYDFGGRDSFSREFPARIRLDADHDQAYEIGDVRARVDGELVEVAEEPSDGVTTVRLEFGQRGSGPENVSLTYDVHGAVRTSVEGLEIMWPVVRGFGAIERISVVVQAPAVSWAACFAGQPGSSKPCTATQITEVRRARFDHNDLPPGGQMTIVVGMPPEAGVSPNQMLLRRWSLSRAFALTPLSIGLALGLAAMAALGVLALWRIRGRDRPPDAEAAVERRPLEPPDDIQPGQLGTVVNQHVDVVDIVGTVLDLAVRGHLRIEGTHEDGMLVWLLHRVVASPELLHSYEKVVLDRLFAGGRDHVTLDDVAQQMRDGLPAIQEHLYADVVAQGWFVERPDAARSRWATAGVVLAFAGVVITGVLAAFTEFGLVGSGVIAAGAILAWGADVAPARAPRGSALLPRLHDFREELATVDTSEVPASQADRLLPFAVVFGVEDRWMAAAAASESLPTELEDFVTTLSGVISARRVRI